MLSSIDLHRLDLQLQAIASDDFCSTHTENGNCIWDIMEKHLWGKRISLSENGDIIHLSILPNSQTVKHVDSWEIYMENEGSEKNCSLKSASLFPLWWLLSVGWKEKADKRHPDLEGSNKIVKNPGERLRARVCFRHGAERISSSLRFK